MMKKIVQITRDDLKNKAFSNRTVTTVGDEKTNVNTRDLIIKLLRKFYD